MLVRNGGHMAKNTTATEIAPAKLADDEQAKAFKLDPHLINLMWAEPFFSKILRKVTKKESTSIPTAGVLAKEGQLFFWWNRKFLAGLTNDQVKGLLKHECYHLIFEHTTTRRHDPHIVWNYATDLAINSPAMIPEEELPQGGLIPGKAIHIDPAEYAKLDAEAKARFDRISGKIEALPPNMSSEWYFGQLMDDDEMVEDLTGGDKSGEGGKPGDGVPGTLDDHGEWGEGMTDAEKELVKGKVKQAMRDAVKKCDARGQWGSVSAEMRSELRKMCSNEVDWKSVLRAFCGMSQRANRSRTMKRINRKYPYIHSGRKVGHSANVAVYVDQSGSVDDESLALIYAELEQLRTGWNAEKSSLEGKCRDLESRLESLRTVDTYLVM